MTTVKNYNGILNHDGSIMVAKTTITQQILHIQGNTVLVKGRKHSYPCEIHKDMYTFMDFVEEGDYAYVKFKNGKAWFVGFRKQVRKEDDDRISISDTESLNNFMKGVDAE